MKLPNKLNILGKTYTVTYVKNPSEVDVHNRESLWGQTDFWTQSIRIYKGNNTVEDVMHTVIHEAIHAIAHELHIMVGDSSFNSYEHENAVDQLALGILNLVKNNNINFKGE